MGKHKLSAPVVISHAEQDDHDYDDTGTSPVDADFVDQVQVFGTEDVNGHAHQHNSPEGKDSLPCVRRPIIAPETNC